MSNTKQALIKTTSKNFFKHWLVLTQPLHKMNTQSINVTALFLYYYFEFKKEISNDDLAWKLTFDYDTKTKIKEELNISQDQVLRNMMTVLRKDKVIVDNKINKSFIPIIDLNKSNSFSLIYKFEIDG